MSKNMTDAAPAANQSVVPITTDQIPQKQDVFPPLVTVPPDALLTGLAHKSIIDMSNTWLQADALIKVPLKATQNTVIINVPIFNDYTNPVIKILWHLHNRFNGIVDYRVSMFGNQTLFGCLEMGVTPIKLDAPTVNELRIIQGLSAPGNGTVVYTFSLGVIVGDDGIMRNFYPTGASASTQIPSASARNNISSAHLVVLSNVPLQTAMANETSEIYLRIESRVNPMSAWAITNFNTINNALKLLEPPPHKEGSQVLSHEGLPNNIPLSSLFGQKELYMTLDGLYNVNGADTHNSGGNTYYNGNQIMGSTPGTLLVDNQKSQVYSKELVTTSFNSDSNLCQFSTTFDTQTDPKAFKYLYHFVNYTGKTSQQFNIHTWGMPKMLCDASKNVFYEPTPVSFTSIGYMFISDSEIKVDIRDMFNLKKRDNVLKDPAQYLTMIDADVIQSLTAVVYTGNDFECIQHNLVDGTKRNIAPSDFKFVGIGGRIFKKVNGKMTQSWVFPWIATFKTTAHEITNDFEDDWWYLSTRGDTPDAWNTFKQTEYTITSQVDIEVNTDVVHLSDFQFTYGEYTIPPVYTLFTKVPELTRRVVFTKEIPTSVSLAIAADGIPTVDTLIPDGFPKLADTEIISFQLVTPNNFQTILTVIWDPNYNTFYMRPASQSIPLYAVYNSHGIGSLLVRNAYRTTIGNLPSTSLATDFLSRVATGSIDDKIILPTRNGPTLTVISRKLLNASLQK